MQQQVQQPVDKITEIYKELQFIQNESQGQYNKEKLMNQKILLFFGFTHQEVDAFYAHFSETKVIEENEYLKMVRLQKQSKTSYIINTPYSLGNITNRQLCLKQYISRIILFKVLLQFKDCQYHIIVNFDNLQGETQQAQLNQIVDFGLFNFGKLTFKVEKVTLINKGINDQQTSFCLCKDIKKGVQDLRQVFKQQTLRYIFQQNVFYKPSIEKKREDFGPMSFFLVEIMDEFAVQLTKILQNYQDKLLLLQQIPILQDEQDLNKGIISLLKNLNDVLTQSSQYSLEITFQLFKGINEVNESHKKLINGCLSKLNTKLMETFLAEKEISIENLYLPQELVNTQQLEFINKMLKKYVENYFKQKNVSEIKNLSYNIKCWNSYSSLMVESIIQNFKQITKSIQPGPKEERDFGVFLFGKSRVGKSTLINILKNPESLTIEKRISELCYVMKNQFQTEFKIEHGCMSETQNITSMQIGDVWYYDCPGFDDNISQQIRIAHRISLYNYLRKTKKVIGFFLIDSSNRDAQIIKDTIDPIYLLLKDKNQLLQDNQKWASLVLVKSKENTRRDYIENWDEAYHKLLEGKYTFYREMYQNDNLCIEFPKPKKNLSQEQILQQNTHIQQKVLKRINEKKQNEDFQLNFDLQIDSKLFYLYEIVLSMLQKKIEQIVGLLENQINIYIQDCEDTLENKKQLIQSLKIFIGNEINQQNVKEVLKKILEWCKINELFKINSIFLQNTIDDVLQCLMIDDYCQMRKISPIKVDSSKLRKNADKIINIIQNIENIELGLKATFIIGSIAAAVTSLGAALLAEGAGLAATEIIIAQIAQRVAIRAAITGVGGASASTITYIAFIFKQNMLKQRYQSYLYEQDQRINT
ncbi:unnamed protein product (macronuclear) [Paramecium tetraurelia]|uniref:Uncharacterized protein n=1 Tax=Paramecium tetraurelia TaxID=5888 RepID=A0E5B1_PARTE|nr:uncharacterized protein GSPATT00023655001 [Paramecium tetraurelia]CAK90478.1 unnamed protein product [Paramecium tetraurelia]|eukprot:XP_001457875.1 hypothetical protein (macronuclear) [Paramecium tetraurelia strain d4-2]